MKMQTMLSQYLTVTDGKAVLDECCKKLISNRIILAWLMKCTMKEYRDYAPDEISSRFIEGDPAVARACVHQDTAGGREENRIQEGRIRGDNTVDDSVTEGRVTYDIRFRAVLPCNGEIITLIINVEAQADFRPGYPLLKRGIYYGGRLLSAQYGTEFQKSHYENLKKVYTPSGCAPILPANGVTV